jgi:hypothetical protein
MLDERPLTIEVVAGSKVATVDLPPSPQYTKNPTIRVDGVEIGDTLVTNENGGLNAAEPMEPIAIEQPTVRMTIGVNKSPLAGREGKFLTSRMIRNRLFKELDQNVALQVAETESADRYEVSGRGQLHLTVLIESMRREGFELEIGPPPSSTWKMKRLARWKKRGNQSKCACLKNTWDLLLSS